jgi:hypothetical protein
MVLFAAFSPIRCAKGQVLRNTLKARCLAYEKIKHCKCRSPEWERLESSSFQPTIAGSLLHQSNHLAEWRSERHSALRYSFIMHLLFFCHIVPGGYCEILCVCHCEHLL